MSDCQKIYAAATADVVASDLCASAAGGGRVVQGRSVVQRAGQHSAAQAIV